jgi:hypothetical protein
MMSGASCPPKPGGLGQKLLAEVAAIVRRGIETFGGTGQSLGKGKVMTLSAITLSIKPVDRS